MITYRHDGLSNFTITVKNDGLVVGKIKRTMMHDRCKRLRNGYYYQPKGSLSVGETFTTVAEVKRSIEGK